MKFLVVFVLAMVLANTTPAVEAKGRMYNAHDVRPNQFPSLVRLEAVFYPNISKCSGTLIRKDFVATAAHCTYVNGTKPTEMRVYLGSNEIKGSLEKRVTVYFINVDVIVHEDYDPLNNRNDIALIRIPEVEIKGSVGVSPLPTPRDFANTRVNVVGWGSISDSHHSSSIAQWNAFTIQRNQDCKTRFAGLLPSHLCLYNPYSAPCSGDSGGPAFYNDVLVGIASYIAVDGCQSDNAVVYTNVTYFLDWIHEKMDSLQVFYSRYELGGTVHTIHEV